MVNCIKCICIAAYAVICAYEDLRKRSIDIRLSATLLLAGLALGAADINQPDIWIGIRGMILSLVPGLVIVALSKISRGAIGAGDGVFILVYGLYEGLKSVLIVLAAAWGICAVIGLYTIVMGAGRGGNKTLPFVTAALPGIMVIMVSKLGAV